MFDLERAGGPAFPVSNKNLTVYGMTLRDYFAAKAMQGIARDIENEEKAAAWAYEMADAMLKARGKE